MDFGYILLEQGDSRIEKEYEDGVLIIETPNLIYTTVDIVPKKKLNKYWKFTSPENQLGVKGAYLSSVTAKFRS